MVTLPDLITDAHMEMLLRLLAAMFAGMAVGLNRDLHDKPIGMRTLGLVSLSSAVVVLAGSSFGDLHFRQDAASRVIQGILTGLGFLGAGVILREEKKLQVHGLTTAATVLAAATFGITAGLGAWFLTFVGHSHGADASGRSEKSWNASFIAPLKDMTERQDQTTKYSPHRATRPAESHSTEPQPDFATGA